MKKGMEKEYKDVLDHAKVVNKNNINLEDAVNDMDNPVIDPNPYELCDLNCRSRNKPHLCQNCFFNTVSEDVFLKDFIDDYITV